jgi:RNA polymerase sigma-70 factor (ECF subfamily)
MRASWEALHAGLARSVRSLKADIAFNDLQQRHVELARFAEPGAVVAYLASKLGDRDEKDRILGVLATLVQRGEHSELAAALLWLGLWPGLDAVYRRRTRHFLDGPDELVSEIAGALTHEVAELDLRAVRRVAATLVRSTERRVLEGRAREWAETNTVTPMGEVWALDDPSPTCRDSILGLPPTLSLDEDLAHLRAWLEPIVGEDCELVLAVLVLEETQREAGARLGLTHEAARKRFQRAFARLRRHTAQALSQLPRETRV